MIHLYSGTPGSGKSFHATQKMFCRLRSRRPVICNFPVNLDYCSYSFVGFWLKKIFKNFPCKKKRLGDFSYVPNHELTVDYLKAYAKVHHKRGRESQTLVIIDECGIMFNPRTFCQADRLGWLEFFSLHRHYGYDFILIAQSDRMIDRQIRSFLEYDHRHRNVGNFKAFGKLLSLLCGGGLFIDVTLYYGLREKVSSDWFRFSRRIAALYDSYALYGEEETEEEIDPSEGLEEEKKQEHPSEEGSTDRNGGTEVERGGDPSEPAAPLP